MKILVSAILIAMTVTGSAVAQSGQDANSAQHSPPSVQEYRATILDTMTPNQLEDMAVTNTAGENLGTLDEIVENRETGERFAVIEYGGTLGIGEKEVLVPINDLRLDGAQEMLIALTTLKALESMGEFDEVEHEYEEIEEAE